MAVEGLAGDAHLAPEFVAAVGRGTLVGDHRRIAHHAVAVAEDRQRHEHVVDDVGRHRAVEPPTYREDRAVGAHGRAAAALQSLDTLLEAPVERPDRRSRALVAVGVDEVAAYAAADGSGKGAPPRRGGGGIDR